MNRMIKISLMAALLIGLLVSITSPVQANYKEFSYYEFADTWPAYTCANGQQLIEHFDFQVQVTNFYTDSGEFFMMEEDVTMTGKVYLQDRPDLVLNYENSQWKNMTKPSGRMQSSGILIKITVPGYGIVFQDIGHFVFEYDPVAGHLVPTVLNGHHEYMDMATYPEGWNFVGPCQYLTSLP